MSRPFIRVLATVDLYARSLTLESLDRRIMRILSSPRPPTFSIVETYDLCVPHQSSPEATHQMSESSSIRYDRLI